MIVFIALFSITLILATGFIYVRIHDIRTGKVATEEEFENKNRKAYTHIVRVKETTTWYGKNILKLTLLFILKFFVYIRFLVDQMLHRTKQHVKKKLTKTLEPSSENPEPSVFLQSIREYKKELTKFQKQLGKRK